MQENIQTVESYQNRGPKETQLQKQQKLNLKESMRIEPKIEGAKHIRIIYVTINELTHIGVM